MSFWSQKTAAIGQKKYGLVKKQGSALQPQSAAVAAMFGGADDDDEPRDQKKEVAQQMRDLGAAQRRRAAQQAAQAAAVDPSIYDYDGVYDQMKEDERKKISARSGLSNTNHSKPGARYIGSLKQAAKVREREFDRVYERQLLKEQEQDKDQYGDTERFVTAAYKKQLQESRKWDAEDKRMDELEERTSAQTSGMAGFYSNLLTRNIAAGADVEKAAVSSYTHGSRRNAAVDEVSSEPVVRQEEDAAASALARFDDAVPPSADDERKARAAFAASRGYDAVAERLAKVEEEDVKPPPPVVEAPQVAPQDAAAAARERFLARKRERAARGK
jgi:coiled-coil domain-containing protein 55